MTMNEQGIQSAQDLWRMAEEEAGVVLGEVPIMIKYLWFPTPQSGGKNPTLFEVGVDEKGNPKEIPLKPGFIVFGMFEDADEVRVYALATSPQDAQGKPNPPHRITLSKHAPVAGVAIMAIGVFVSAIADELLMLAGIDPDDDDDDDDDDEPEDGEDEEQDENEPEDENDLPLDESDPPPNGGGEAPPPEL
jgi:hypothetical protein